MIPGIASLVFIPLLAVTFAHLMWAFGSTWPVKDQKTLARTVAGFRGIEKMPNRLISGIVAIVIFAAGIWALAMTDTNKNPLLDLGGAVLFVIFLARGVAAYLPQWAALTPEEPFRTFDRKVYSPLCLVVAAGFAMLLYWRFQLV